MSAPVHILATCRKPELIGGTLLVFNTLRIGFPTAKVTVHFNNISNDEAFEEVTAKAARTFCAFRSDDTIHHKWIENLLESEPGPFWILDTDVVFWSSVEGWDMSECFLSGTYTPRFADPFTRCDTQQRLHTCLLYLDPSKIKDKISERLSMHQTTLFNPCINMIHPAMIPNREKTYFFDTCALLYQAIGGTPFNKEQLNCFEHLHCGTWSDLLEPVFPKMQEFHRGIFRDPKSAHGLREIQDTFYRTHAA